MKEQLKNFIITIVVLVIAGIGFVAFSYFYNQNAIIDNPLDKEIKVQIDSAEYTVPANSQLEAKTSYGEHEIKLNGQSVGKFTNSWNINESFLKILDGNFFQKPIINPTESEYVISYEIYSTSANTTNNIEDKFVSDLYIPATWDYNLNEEFPKEVTISKRSGGSKSVTKEKIFRIEEYVKYYGLEEEYKKILEEAINEEI